MGSRMERMATVRNLSSGPQEWGVGKGKENVPHLSSCAPHQFSTPTMYLSHLGGAFTQPEVSAHTNSAQPKLSGWAPGIGVF